jgi:hypothetical protein
MSMERQRLAMMREKFEEEKRQTAEQQKLQVALEQGRMQREKMQQEGLAAQRQAQAAATLKASQDSAITEFTKLAGSGDVQGAHAMVPLLSRMGVPVSLEGEENGLPRYRIGPDPEAAAREAVSQPGTINPYGGDETLRSSLSRMGGIGYPTDDTGTLEEPMGIGSSSNMTAEQIARVTGGGTEQRAATDQTLAAEAGLAVEPDLGPPPPPGLQPGPTAPLGLPEYTDTANPAAVLRERVLSRGQAPEPEGPPLPADDTDPSPIKPEFQRAAQALDPLAGLRPTTLAPKPAAEPDYTGAVPKNVIDMGAMHQQTLASLNPALESIVKSYPEALQDSARNTADAVRSLPLGAVKGVEAMKSLRSSPDSLIQANIAADASKGVNEAKVKALASKESIRRQDHGFSGLAAKAAEPYQFKEMLERRTSRELGMFVLTNKDSKGNHITEDDYLAGAQISRLLGDRGASTEGDVERALGEASAGFLKNIYNKAFKAAFSGLVPGQRAALANILKKSGDEDKKKAFEFIGNLEGVASKPDMDPDTALGVKRYIDVIIPEDWRKEYRAKKKPAQAVDGDDDEEEDPAAAAPGNDSDFRTALDSAASQQGLNPDHMRLIIGPESGGRGDAKNTAEATVDGKRVTSSASGIIQMIDPVAQQYTNPRTGKKFANAAELRGLSPAEQAPIAAQYWHDKGLTKDSPPEDYALAVAAPAFVGKSADRTAVVYPKGTDNHAVNKPWWPADGGDITVGSILDFYIHGKKAEKKDEAPKKTPSAGGQAAARAKLLEGIEDAPAPAPLPPRASAPVARPSIPAALAPQPRALTGATDESVAAAYDAMYEPSKGTGPRLYPREEGGDTFDSDRRTSQGVPGHVFSREEAAKALARNKGRGLPDKRMRQGS